MFFLQEVGAMTKRSVTTLSTGVIPLSPLPAIPQFIYLWPIFMAANWRWTDMSEGRLDCRNLLPNF